MQVLKFGGSSVANAENIKKVVKVVTDASKKDRTILVASALGGVTDELLNICNLASTGDDQFLKHLKNLEERHLHTAKELLPITQQSSLLSRIKVLHNNLEDICQGIFLLGELSDRTRDKVVSFGEVLSTTLISSKLTADGTENKWVDSRELIKTDSRFGKAQVNYPTTDKNIRDFFNTNKHDLFVMPGFIASNEDGQTTTLGRGGSDFTGAIVAAALNAESLEIWTDVSGMMTADPRAVPSKKHIPRISYQEAMELSHFGAKVIYPPTIRPVMEKNIPVWVKNTFAPDDIGTIIHNTDEEHDNTVRGLSNINNIVLISLEGSGMVGIPGFSMRLFGALASEGVNVILITQSSSEYSICVGIELADKEKARKAVDTEFALEIKNKTVQPLIVEENLSIIALVGDSMKSHTGVSGKMFSALGRNGINIRAIAQGASERNISAVISMEDVKKALNVLHEEFFEIVYKQVNLYLVGLGNVGKRLVQQIARQHNYLKKHLSVDVRIIGIANSRRMLIQSKGINLNNWEELLEDVGEETDMNKFTESIISNNLRNSVYADVTANNELINYYERLLKKSISVVACNKVAAASEFEFYNKLKETANEFSSSFLFETNVGAGLPIIATLSDLIRSGDDVKQIEAVLSGTLNFVFNNYDGSRPFAEVVKQAQDEGYTEPDPRLDLNGKDVARKILILARESGATLEMEDIKNEPFMSPLCFEGTVDDFYACLLKEEAHFIKLYNDAHAKGNKLKFVASFKNGKASVGLMQIPPGHDFYHLYGKDNIVLFYTSRYSEQPMVVKGAGAGADVTASGVFADIMRAARV